MEDVTSKFFVPDRIGDEFTGAFRKFAQTRTPDGKPSFAIDTDKGLIGMSAVIKNAIAPHAETLKEGDQIRVVFLGEKESKKGNPSKIYDVYLNGVLISGYPEATPESLKEFFADKE